MPTSSNVNACVEHVMPLPTPPNPPLNGYVYRAAAVHLGPLFNQQIPCLFRRHLPCASVTRHAYFKAQRVHAPEAMR